MVRIRRIVPALMSACLAFSAAGTVSSSGQMAWRAQIIQYSDLLELVRTYSPQVQMERILYKTRLGRYESAGGKMMETRRCLREEVGDMEKDGDSNGVSSYRTQARVLEEATKDMDKQIRSAKGGPSIMSLRRMEDTIIWTAQSLMGTYHSFRTEQKSASAGAELMQGKCEKAIRQVGLRMVSQAAADEAGKTATAAANKVQSLQDDMERIRRELLMVTGYPGGSRIQIGMLPAPGQSRVSGVTLRTDRWRTLGSNCELRQRKGSSSGGAIKEHHVRQRTIGEGEVITYGQIDTLYQNVLAGHIMQQSTVTAQIARGAEWKAVSSKTDLGILPRQEYLEAGPSYLDRAAAKAQADVSFQQVMDMYDWVVKGSVAIN